jgi:uncharacterized membrane protein YbhN (UPF0104 family)
MKWLRLWPIQLLISLILLELLIYFINPERLWKQVISVPYEKMVPWVLGCEIAYILFWAGGLGFLARRIAHLPYIELVLHGFRMQVLSIFIPGRIGDFSIIYLLRKHLAAAPSTALMLVDKAISLLVLLPIATLGLAVFLGWKQVLIFCLILGIGILSVFWLFSSRTQGLRDRVANFFLRKHVHHAKGFKTSVVGFFSYYPGLAGNLLMTSCRILLAGLSLMLILSWLGADVPYWQVILVQAVTQLATLVPITFMGIGMTESVNVILFNQIGINPAIVVAACLAGRAIQIGFYLLFVPLWLGVDKQSNEEA